MAQPTDVVKVRMQASKAGEARYSGSLAAYKAIAKHEGVKGLRKGNYFIYLDIFILKCLGKERRGKLLSSEVEQTGVYSGLLTSKS